MRQQMAPKACITLAAPNIVTWRQILHTRQAGETLLLRLKKKKYPTIKKELLKTLHTFRVFNTLQMNGWMKVENPKLSWIYKKKNSKYKREREQNKWLWKCFFLNWLFWWFAEWLLRGGHGNVLNTKAQQRVESRLKTIGWYRAGADDS